MRISDWSSDVCSSDLPTSLAIPHRWKKSRKIFVNSMSDLFHEQVSDTFILEVWRVMRETPHHNYQILTKRPERMASIVSKQIKDVLPNVWLGTSVEDADVEIGKASCRESVCQSV